MSPPFDEVYGHGALRALESDLDHPVLGACRVAEFPEGFIPQAPRGAAMIEIKWERGGRASVVACPELWFFSWLDAGDIRGAGLVAHLALVLDDWRVAEARCLAVSPDAASLLRHCGFRPWTAGPVAERHLLTITAADVAPYVRDSRREWPSDAADGHRARPPRRLALVNQAPERM